MFWFQLIDYVRVAVVTCVYMTNFLFDHVFVIEPDILDHLIANNDEQHRNPENRREIHYLVAFHQL